MFYDTFLNTPTGIILYSNAKRNRTKICSPKPALGERLMLATWILIFMPDNSISCGFDERSSMKKVYRRVRACGQDEFNQ